jgi:hypothetical protein
VYVGKDGREVRHAFQGESSTHLYDTASFDAQTETIEPVVVYLETAPGVLVEDTSWNVTLRAASGRQLVSSSSSVDYFGNKTLGVALGCATCGDEVISTFMEPALPDPPDRDPTRWLWRTTRTYVVGSAHPIVRNDTSTVYDEHGNPVQVAAVLSGSLALGRSEPGSNTPPVASYDRSVVVSQSLYDDDFGMLTNEQGPSGRCRELAYDTDYNQLPISEAVFTGGCGQNGLTTAAVYDRGLGLVVWAYDMQDQPTKVDADPAEPRPAEP